MTLFADMLRLITAAIVSLFLLSGCQGSASEYRQECVVWHNVTQMVEREPRMEMVCQKNAQCTGFDCAGNYTYQGLMSIYQRFVYETCFGIAIHPCNTPVDMEVYVESPGTLNKTQFRHTFVSDEKKRVTGATFTIASGTADAFIDVHMKHISVRGQPYLRIGMRLKIRLTVGGIHLETWPRALAVQLMRDTEIPVPPCDKSVQTPPHTFGSCKVIARGAIQEDTHEMSEKGLGKTCMTNKMYSCLSGEMCLGHDGTNHGHCVCLIGYVRHNDSDPCKPIAPTAIPILIRGHHAQEPKKAASKELVIVLCSCVAGIAVIGIVVLLVILRLRKQRARYAQHEQLLNNDDDDDVEPLDVST